MKKTFYVIERDFLSGKHHMSIVNAEDDNKAWEICEEEKLNSNNQIWLLRKEELTDLRQVIDKLPKERIEELESKAWKNMTGEDVANNLSEKEAKEYYKLLGN